MSNEKRQSASAAQLPASDPQNIRELIRRGDQLARSAAAG
jgi:hypothetical protein